MDCMNMPNRYRNSSIKLSKHSWEISALRTLFSEQYLKFPESKIQYKAVHQRLVIQFPLKNFPDVIFKPEIILFNHFNTCNEWLTKPNTVPKSTFINKWIQPDKWHIPRHSNTSWDLETTFSEIKDFWF